MIVKAQTFKTTSKRSGRGGYDFSTAGGRAKYLEKDGRAVGGVSTQNIVDNDRWAAEMDRTTAAAHLRGTVVGREYILSPSPEDHVLPEAMRDFALEWVGRCFPNAEAAVAVHVDSKERISLGKDPICHAHVYVNAVDLETGRKVVISNSRVREVHDIAQDMCRDRGMVEAEKYYDKNAQRVVSVGSRRTDAERNPRWYRRDPSRKSAEYDKSAARKGGIGRHEYDMAKSGKELEKTFVRRNLREAVNAAKQNGTQLGAELRKRGVTAAKAADGDFKYAKAGSGRFFKGRTLAPDLCREALRAQLARAKSLALGDGKGKGLSL